MRLTFCLPFVALVFYAGSARAETGKDAGPSNGESKPAAKDANAPEGSKTMTGMLCTKADTAPDKVLGVLMVKVEKVVKEKTKTRTETVLLVADGEVGKSLGELLDKQAKVEVTGRPEGDYFRVDGFKLIAEGADESKPAKKKDEPRKDDGKTGEGADAKKKGDHPPAAKHPPKKNDPNPKPPTDPVQVAP